MCGLTEIAPLATVARPRDGDPQGAWRARLIGSDGSVLRHDWHSAGGPAMRDPTLTGSHRGGDGRNRFRDGWLCTSDAGALDIHPVS